MDMQKIYFNNEENKYFIKIEFACVCVYLVQAEGEMPDCLLHFIKFLSEFHFHLPCSFGDHLRKYHHFALNGAHFPMFFFFFVCVYHFTPEEEGPCCHF